MRTGKTSSGYATKWYEIWGLYYHSYTTTRTLPLLRLIVADDPRRNFGMHGVHWRGALLHNYVLHDRIQQLEIVSGKSIAG